MKVLFSLTYYTPYISGLTLYVKRLAEALVRRGYQATVITSQYDHKLKILEKINDVEIIRTRPIIKISKGFLSLDWIVKSFRDVKKHDVVIVNLPQAEGFIPAFFGKLLGKKVIAIYHCEVVLPSGFFNKLIEKVLNQSNKLTLFLSNKIITYTKDFAEHSNILPDYKEKLNFIYPPILMPKVNNRVQDMIRKQIGVKPGFVIGVAARLAAEKGIEYLFEAIPYLNSKLSVIPTESRHISGRVEGSSKYRNVKDSSTSLGMTQKKFKILIAGSLNPAGEEKYKNRIFKLVGKYKENIIFLGEVKEEEMGSFYSLIDVLVLPSINSTEAFGVVQVEAMMMGVPVIATDLPGVRIPIQKTGMGKIVPIKNSQKLAEAVMEIWHHKKRYLNKSEEILKILNTQNCISNFEKILITP